MSAGALTNIAITLFGAVAGVALFAAHYIPGLMSSLGALWVVCVSCFCAGPVIAFMCCGSTVASTILRTSAVFSMILAMASAGMAMTSLLDLAAITMALNLWLLAAGSLCAGIARVAGTGLMAPGKS
jgi:hypothetical protein